MLHLTALVVVPGCLALGYWQLHRALSGNTLSWAYTVEWPFFAAYGVYMWWRIVHEQPTEPPHASQATVAAQGRPTELPDLHEEEDEESDEGDDGANPEELVGEFRTFLDSIRPEDFSS